MTRLSAVHPAARAGRCGQLARSGIRNAAATGLMLKGGRSVRTEYGPGPALSCRRISTVVPVAMATRWWPANAASTKIDLTSGPAHLPHRPRADEHLRVSTMAKCDP
jgi:hypothetical protein